MNVGPSRCDGLMCFINDRKPRNIGPFVAIPSDLAIRFCTAAIKSMNDDFEARKRDSYLKGLNNENARRAWWRKWFGWAGYKTPDLKNVEAFDVYVHDRFRHASVSRSFDLMRVICPHSRHDNEVVQETQGIIDSAEQSPRVYVPTKLWARIMREAETEPGKWHP